MGRKLLGSFPVEKAVERLSLSQDCMVVDRLCSGLMTGVELSWVSSCPTHIAKTCAAAGNYRREPFFLGSVLLVFSTDKTLCSL